jgi:hypothetical protein
LKLGGVCFLLASRHTLPELPAEFHIKILTDAVMFEGKSFGQIAGKSNVRLRFTVTPPGKLYSFVLR